MDGAWVDGGAVDLIVRQAAGLVREVVAALVRDGDAVAGPGQDRDLVAPGVPAFGEAVEEEGQRAILRAGQDGVELEVAGLYEPRRGRNTQPGHGLLGQRAGTTGQGHSALAGPA